MYEMVVRFFPNKNIVVGAAVDPVRSDLKSDRSEYKHLQCEEN